MTLFVLIFIKFSLYSVCYTTRDDRNAATLSDVLAEFLGIIAHISKNFPALEVEVIEDDLSINNIVTSARG